jgi:hypothetical protein
VINPSGCGGERGDVVFAGFEEMWWCIMPPLDSFMRERGQRLVILESIRLFELASLDEGASGASDTGSLFIIECYQSKSTLVGRLGQDFRSAVLVTCRFLVVTTDNLLFSVRYRISHKSPPAACNHGHGT